MMFATTEETKKIEDIAQAGARYPPDKGTIRPEIDDVPYTGELMLGSERRDGSRGASDRVAAVCDAGMSSIQFLEKV